MQLFVIDPVVRWILYIWIVFAVFLLLNKSYLKGKFGEWFISWRLHKLDPHKYRVLNDILLLSQGNTETTQIDHIVVSNYGLFCIETKTYSGWIFGNAKEEFWTQVIYRYKKKFYNPLRQNYAHIKSIELLVKPIFPKLPVISFVVFPSADKLQISGTELVGGTRVIIEKLKRFNVEMLSDAERDKVIQILTSANITDPEARKVHNSQIYEKKSANT